MLSLLFATMAQIGALSALPGDACAPPAVLH
jgi:hypothetical protein